MLGEGCLVGDAVISVMGKRCYAMRILGHVEAWKAEDDLVGYCTVRCSVPKGREVAAYEAQLLFVC